MKTFKLLKPLSGKLIRDEDNIVILEATWKVFTDVVDRGIFKNISCWHMSFMQSLDSGLSLYDDFCIERHQTVSFTEMYSAIEDFELDFDQDKIDDWRAEVLCSGYSGFVNDW